MVNNHGLIRIVLTDDDGDYHFLFEELIKNTGYAIQYIPYKNGIELMNGLKMGDLPDIIFLDINMPLKNGKECLAEIKAGNVWKNIPVVMFSASDSYRDVEESFLMGANLYVVKSSFFAAGPGVLQQLLSLPASEYMPPGRDNFIFLNNKPI